MLNSIKSRILILTLSLLILFGFVVTGAALLAFYHDKELIITGNGFSISSLTERVNQEITKLENNAMDLALLGESYYSSYQKGTMDKASVIRIFENYPQSLGGGIWFKPYKLQKNKKRSCIYAFRNSDNQIVTDDSFESEEYNYLNQLWYIEIISKLEKGKKLFWSGPYYENQGAETLMTTVGAGIYYQGELVGLSTVDWQMDDILKNILAVKPTPNSFVLFADKTNDYIIATTEPKVDNASIIGKPLSTMKWYSEQLKDGSPFDYNGEKYIPYIKQLNNGLFLIVNVPLIELFDNAVHHLFVLLSVLLISTILIVCALFLVLKHNINTPISKLTEIAKKISQGHLDENIKLDKPSELAQLAQAFNKMKTDIKTHLTELAKVSGEKEKIESELAIAKDIQTSALPTNFPKDDHFELVASMAPAREVGGDFYDFFHIDENHLAFTIADVSGKGITAALYMMSAKTAIKNMLQAGYPLEEAINKTNNSLCDNQSGMFVTAFIAILDIESGKIQYVNAGHCPPLLKTKDGYNYIETNHNIILGVKPDYSYKSGELTLQNHSRLFLYTDGVTEAQDKNYKMFGEDRLKKTLNQKETSLLGVLTKVYKKIKLFVKDAPQSDDITMMILEFDHKKTIHKDK